ncbi:hypothetical protein THTE_4262 [Thermogutta terrifontis]|uniref:Uncharacterized protein n=1 Tax=Thermogutta terrifontis TaxID=1331910 RepID=A0A286RLK9_9BACT|nr:hypothetical protein THTE_4262 [Thermogutta terrifontis]
MFRTDWRGRRALGRKIAADGMTRTGQYHDQDELQSILWKKLRRAEVSKRRRSSTEPVLTDYNKNTRNKL